MSSGSGEIKEATHNAEILVLEAKEQGLLRAGTTLSYQAVAMVRLEMLSQALVLSRQGQWIRDSAERPDSEYAQVFGYLARLAKFEISHGPDVGNWRHFLSLFRIYFGSGIDKLAPSIFLAAVFHPDAIISAKVLADVHAITEALEAEEVAYRSMIETRLLD